MHGENVTRRQDEVHHTENRLLDFASVSGTPDQHNLAGEIQKDERSRVGAIP